MSNATIDPAPGDDHEAKLALAAIEKIAGADRRAANRESQPDNFNREIEYWARHALAANGFGDYP